MLQIDPFATYGIGAGFAFAESKALKSDDGAGEDDGLSVTPELRMLKDESAVQNLLFNSLFFGPQATYFLAKYSDWDTMHVYEDTPPPSVLAGFSFVNISSGVAGYLVSRILIKNDMDYAGFLNWLLGVSAMHFVAFHGWDGSGYKRMFSETREDFENFTWSTPLGWLNSSMTRVLGLGALVVTPVLLRWMQKSLDRSYEAMEIKGTEEEPDRSTIIQSIMSVMWVTGPATAATGSALVRALGWLGGTAAFGALAWFGGVREGGQFKNLYDSLMPEPSEADQSSTREELPSEEVQGS